MQKIIERIKLDILVCGVVAVLVSFLFKGLKFSASVFLGGMISYFSYISIVIMVDAFVLKKKQKGLWFKVFLRYGLIIFLVYVIIRFSYLSIPGLFIGLSLTVAAFFGEGLYYTIKNMMGND